MIMHARLGRPGMFANSEHPSRARISNEKFSFGVHDVEVTITRILPVMVSAANKDVSGKLCRDFDRSSCETGGNSLNGRSWRAFVLAFHVSSNTRAITFVTTRRFDAPRSKKPSYHSDSFTSG